MLIWRCILWPIEQRGTREWVTGEQGASVTAGGSILEEARFCSYGAFTSHSGEANDRTGFGVLREIVLEPGRKN